MNIDSGIPKPSLTPHRHNPVSFTCNKGTATFYTESNKIKFADSLRPDVDLGYSAGRAFELLIFNAGQVISRQDFFEHAWAGRVVTQNSLNQVIAQLREAIGDNTDRQVIKTMSRQGYVLGSAHLTDAASVADSGSIATDIITPPSSAPPPPPLDKASEAPHFFLRKNKLSRKMLYLIITLGSFALWLVKIDWGLLLPSGIAIDSQAFEKTQIIYVAPSEPALTALKTRVEKLAQLLSAQNLRDKVIVFNESLGYYDIFCLKTAEHPKFIILSKDAAADLSPDTLKRCLE